MGLSRQASIITLLVIDTAFFFLEIIVGYATKSLALVADSFHMLNDIISLFIALWAIKKSGMTEGFAAKYTYGWQRAEILGALVNGVFLIALCVSIFLEAIKRFVEPEIISNPLLIVAVGSAGLASNIVGLFLFHDHGHGGHSHGEEGEDDHGHSHGDEEESVGNSSHSHGLSHPHSHSHGQGHVREPESAHTHDHAHDHSHGHANGKRASSSHAQRSGSASSGHNRRNSHSLTADDIYVLPAQNRALINDLAESRSSRHSASESTPLLRSSADHSSHNHARPKDGSEGSGGAHGHDHANMNMRAVFLHVLGDALGNIGVIATGLFVHFTSFSWRFYADPVISLVITVIILSSAVPLCKSASLILLQVAPPGIRVDEIREDLESLQGVKGVHELHVWQLSDTKLVASVHVRIARQDQHTYMQVAQDIKTCLHAFGIHSVTIQPEFLPSSLDAIDEGEDVHAQEDEACLLDCDPDCKPVKIQSDHHGHVH
ncbi:Zinc resistance conferring protein [Savitreella phatthalungensis]